MGTYDQTSWSGVKLKTIDVEMQLCSINERYMIIGCKCRKARLALSNKYRKCKDDLARIAVGGNVKDATKINIYIATYKDIDANVKLILDALETKGVIDNDRQILELHVYKTPAKRGTEDRVKVEVETLPLVYIAFDDNVEVI